MAKVEVPNPITDYKEKAPVSQQKILLTQDSNDAIKEATLSAIGASAENMPAPQEVKSPVASAIVNKYSIDKVLADKEKGFIDNTKENLASAWEGVKSAQTAKYAYDMIEDYAYTEELGEPDYVMSDDTVEYINKTLKENGAEQYIGMISKAESEGHALRLMNRIIEDNNSFKKGMENPNFYIAGNIGGSIADATAWGTGFVAGTALRGGVTAVQINNATKARAAVQQYAMAQSAGLTGPAGLKFKGLTDEAMALAKSDPIKATSLALQGRGYNKITADLIANGNVGIGLGFGRGAAVGLSSVVPTELIQAEGDITTYDHRGMRVMTGFALGGLLGGTVGKFAESANMRNAYTTLLNTSSMEAFAKGLDDVVDGKVVGAVQNTRRTIGEVFLDIRNKAASVAVSKRKVVRSEIAAGKSLDEVTYKDVEAILPTQGYTKLRIYDDAGVDTGKAKSISARKLQQNLKASDTAYSQAKAKADADIARLTKDENLEWVVQERFRTGKIAPDEMQRLKSSPDELAAYKKTIADDIAAKVNAEANISKLKKALDFQKSTALFSHFSPSKAGLAKVKSYNPKELMATGQFGKGDIKRLPRDVEASKSNISGRMQEIDRAIEEVKKLGYGAVNKSEIEFKAFYDESWGKLPGFAADKIPNYKTILDDVRSRPDDFKGNEETGSIFKFDEEVQLKDSNMEPLLRDKMSKAMQADAENSPPVRVALSWVNAWFNKVAAVDRTKVRSAIQFVRSLAGDTQGSTDIAAKAGAMREKQVLGTRMKTQIIRHHNDAVKEYEQLYPAQKKTMSYNGSEFSERTFMYLEGLMEVPQNMPKMKKYVESWAKVSDDMYKIMNNPGILDGRIMRSVSGAENIAGKIDKYVPHVQSMPKYAAIVRKHGNKVPEDFFYGYFKMRHPNLTDGELNAISSGYLQHMRKGNVIDAENGSMMLNQNSIDEFIDSYVRPLGKMSEQELESLKGKMGRNLAADTAAFGNLRSRVNIDMGYRATVRDINGADVEIKMIDFFKTDTLDIMEKYIDKSSGAIALARVTMDGMVNGKMTRIVNGITNENEFKKVMASIDDVANANGVSEKSRNMLIHEFTDSYNGLMGRLDPKYNNTINDYVGYMNKLATIIIAPVFIASAGSELVKAATIAGFETIKNPISKIAGALRSQGKVGDDLAQEMRDVFALGNSNLMMHMDLPTISKYGEYLGQPGKSVIETKISRALTRGANAVYKYSGTTGVTDMFSNYMGVTMTRKLIKEVVQSVESGKKVGDIHGIRGKEYGFDKETIDAIYKEVKKHGKFKNGSSDFQLEKLGIEDWDAGVRHKMTMIMDNVTRRAILQGDEATRRAWMNSPFAKMLLQFKSFGMYSLSKDFLFNIHTRDMRGAMAIAGSMGSGLMSYMALTYMGSIGRPDRDKYLEERLSTDALLRAAVARSGMGFLTMMFDTGMILGGQDPLFIHARSANALSPTGHLMSQFPSLGVVDRASRLIGGTTSDLWNYGTLSKESFNTFTGLAPQFFFVTPTLRGMAENFKAKDQLE